MEEPIRRVAFMPTAPDPTARRENTPAWLSPWAAGLAVGLAAILLSIVCAVFCDVVRASQGWVWAGAFALICGVSAYGFRHWALRKREDWLARLDAERRLADEHCLLRALIDALPPLIFVMDTAGRFTVANQALARHLGAESPEALLGKTVRDFFPEPLARQLEKAEQSVIQQGTPVLDHEHILPDSHGQDHWFLCTKLPLRDPRGRIMGLVCIDHCITEFKQTQEHVRLQSAALSASANGILISDRDGRVIWANEAVTEMTGYPLDELAGKTLRLLQSGQHDPAFYRQLWATILDGRVWRGELVNRRKNGTLYYEDMTITPVRNEAGTITHFVAVKQDVTAKKRDEQHAIQAQKMESIGRLAGGIAHDFNNILQTILGFSDILLAAMQPSHELRPDVEEIRKAANRATDLTRQLMTFSRTQQLALAPMQLNDLVRTLGTMLRRVIGENIELTTRLAPALNPVNADAGQLEALITSLAVHARDSMPNGGQLTLTTSTVTLAAQDAIMMPEATPGAFVCLAVADTGQGLDRDAIPHLFEPFYTLPGQGRGTGLSLAMAYGIAKQHKGWINVYSETGQGTTFKLYLPALTDTAPAVCPGKTFVMGALKGRGERILLVEDEPGVQQLAVMVLRANGYEVAAASSLREAAVLFEHAAAPFDLVFCDVLLPDGNGLTLLERLLTRRPGLRVLLTSGHSDQESRWPAIHQRGWPFLQKPYPVATLLKAVAQALQPPA